jgi:hypothetical protein
MTPHPDYPVAAKDNHQERTSTMTETAAEFFKCLKPDCLRKVKPGVAYCCAQCSAADAGGYELDPGAHPMFRHDDRCDGRTGARGEWTWAEAQAHLQPGDTA